MDWSSGCCFESNWKWKMWKVSLHFWFLHDPSVQYFVCFSHVQYLFLGLSEMLDGCRALLSIATVTSPSVFDQLLKSIRSVKERSLWFSNKFIVMLCNYSIFNLYGWSRLIGFFCIDIPDRLAPFNCYLV